MEQATKKKVLIIGSLLVIASVGGYFLYKKYGKKKVEGLKKDDSSTSTDTTSTQVKTPGGVSTSSGSPLSNPEDIKKFQDWMDSKHPNWVNGKNLNKGDGYGVYGPSTSKAWSSYSKEYATLTTSLTAEQLKAQRDKSYQDAWMSAKKAGAPSFVFEGKAYDSATGKVYVNPATIQVGDLVYALDKVSGYTGAGLVTAYDSGGSSFGNFYKNQLVGKVTATSIFGSYNVENNKQPMQSSTGYATTFFVPKNLVTKVKPQYVQP